MFLTVDLSVQAAKIQMVANRSRQVIYYNSDKVSVSPGLFEDSEIHSHKQWHRGQVLANHFWVRWIREYLPVLQGRKKWIMIEEAKSESKRPGPIGR